MSEHDEPRGGWEDLFSPLTDDASGETTLPEPSSAPPRIVPERVESQPVPVAQAGTAFDPSALYSALQEDIAAEGVPAATVVPDPAEPEPAAPADASTGLTRRELREQRAAAAESGPVPVAPQPPESLAETAPAQVAPPPPAAEFPAARSFPPSTAAPESSASAAGQAVQTPTFPPAPAPAMQHAADTPQHAVPGQTPEALAGSDAPRLPQPFAVPTPVPGPEPVPVPWDPAPELQAERELPPTVAMPVAEPGAESVVVPTVPVSYDAVAAAEPPAVPPVDGGFPMALIPPPPGRRGGRSLRWLAWFIPVVLIVGAVVGGGVYVWTHYEDKVRQVLGIGDVNDYSGEGNGEAAVVTIHQGDTGSDIALDLYQAGVTKSWKAFNDLANQLAHSSDCAAPDPSNGCWPIIQFGNYNLQKQMSAQSALAALQDPANKVTNNIVIPEGSTLPQVLQIISATTGISLDDLKAAAANPAQFGAANPANSLEGYLFPDTYALDGTETATSVLQRLVNETFQKLDALGVPADQRHAFLTGASIVQKESGPVAGDAAKVARVFQNRLAQNMKLQSDATVAYGAGNTTSIWNSSAQLSDASNPYNTYVHAGLPIGPIAAPGAVALDAWAHPADGDWLFFVPINLKTGETMFSSTDAQHEQYVQQLVQWCEASAENAAYCK